MKRRGRKEGATGSHTTHNINNRDEDNSQNGGEGGGWRRKDRQSTAEKRLQKNLPWHLENIVTSLWDITPGSNAICRWLGAFLWSRGEASLSDWSAGCLRFWIEWLIKVNCSDHLQTRFGPGKPRVDVQQTNKKIITLSCLSFFRHIFCLVKKCRCTVSLCTTDWFRDVIKNSKLPISVVTILRFLT